MKKLTQKIKLITLFVCMLGSVAFSYGQTKHLVKGNVTDDLGIALPGATIVEKGTTHGVSTDFDGNYSMEVSDPNAILVISYIGFEKQEVPINHKSEVNIMLQSSASTLDEVVLVGYGVVKKKDLTGSISQVDAAALADQSPNSVTDVLRGNVAGLSVGFASSPKGVSNMQIRGNNSLSAGTSPLIVVDGMIYNGDLADINPADIDKVDVMKDASSAAVYGARGANGVVLISTKRGTTDKPVININTSVGLASEANPEKPYGPQAYADWRTDVFKSINPKNTIDNPGRYDNPNNLPPGVTLDQWLAYDGSQGDPTRAWLNRIGFQDVEIGNYLEGKSINWYDRIFQNGFRNDINASISGRGNGLNYYWSLGRTSNEGIIVGEKFEVLRSRLNLDADITDWLTVGMNTQFAQSNEGFIPADRVQIERSSPWGSEFDDEGNIRLSPQDDNGTGAVNAFLARTFNDRVDLTNSLDSRIYAKIKLPLGFSYEMGFTNTLQYHEFFNHAAAASPANVVGSAQRWNEKQTEYQLDNILRWNKAIDKHSFDLMLLAYAEKYQSFVSDARANTFSPSDALGYSNLQAGAIQTASSYDEESTGDAVMTRMNYNYDSKYLLTVTMRRDGYSAFGANYKRAYFPSIAGGWTVSEEDFFKSDLITFLKLRLSYGENGNRGFGRSRGTSINGDGFLNFSSGRGLGRYASLSELSGGKYLNVDQNGNVITVSTLDNTTQENPDLRWERTKAVNAGLDFSLLGGKVEGSIDVYKNITTDLIVTRQLPNVIGFNNVFTNLGEIENKGLEFTLSTSNFERENFTWNTGFNFSLNRNTINKLYGDLDENGKELDDITNQRFIGHATDAIWGQEVIGVWQQNEAAKAAEYGVLPGDFKILDKNNDGIFTQEDNNFKGFTTPRFRLALSNRFTLFKNIDFSFDVYSSLGQKRAFNSAKNRNGFVDRTNSLKTPYWTPDNPRDDYARLFSSDGSSNYSVYRDASFVRLNNVTLAYRVPKSLTEKVSIQSFRIYGNIRNLAVWAPDWDLYDPESQDLNGTSGLVPTPRFFTIGLDISL